MPDAPRPSAQDRFAPRAHRQMAGMFDAVTPRYELLNSLMTLGQDKQWRVALARCVPESAAVVIDLCTGNGDSLPGLRRPGRTVLGLDVSFGMLEAATEWRTAGWGPRLVCADAFHLPVPDRSVDAITIAFGIRNLRPRAQALAEAARVLRPGGTLAVLEATAPAGGPFAAIHRLHLRHAVPLLGRLSPDPSAYQYLSRSIFEFGSGEEFERDLATAGFSVEVRQSFLLGATRIWSARLRPAAGQIAANRPPAVQDATGTVPGAGEFPPGRAVVDTEWRVWGTVQLVMMVALCLALVWAALVLLKLGSGLPLQRWQQNLAWILILGGISLSAVRAVFLFISLLGPPPRR